MADIWVELVYPDGKSGYLVPEDFAEVIQELEPELTVRRKWDSDMRAALVKIWNIKGGIDG